MKFHTLLPVRDEADIIGQCLQHLLSWADHIYVFDTGSVDNTWEIVHEFARQDKRVIPLKKDPVYFSETRLRGYLFHVARQQMQDGDWFLRVDADEFHHVPPPEFVQTHLQKHETIVYHQYYDFRLTASEVVSWEAGRETIGDRMKPIEERRRWFTPSIYSEPRLCRYRETMKWPPTVSFPFNAGFVARERLPIRHYPHRDPIQLDRRCRLRAIMMANLENRQNWTHPEQHHWFQGEWRQFVAPDNLPELQYWQPGASLPAFQFTNHLAPLSKRVVQQLVHTLFLPVLDKLRPGWTEGCYPQWIQPEALEQLQHSLKV
ncbi:glycosyltransferase [Synechococcales cyanobacterium C]|uniref:Glycosyltransferase n=1 Tax=Petrachloros mirabilis ULC683 TaxID=2781853 RepID=A0A8K2A123_9CYAN|nr:glycosyltransferase family 2 protein [Petrachloros mirabilis]NCJ07646.1 glycosyltransferase [Petrachloros mirabilis ULC683]